jgi:gamma-glutamyltranspeptidase/glutathione hydrolase
MVASSQPLATQIGLDILKKGGTAVDAGSKCGLRFDGTHRKWSWWRPLAIVWDKTEKLYGLNASGRSPKTLTMSF